MKRKADWDFDPKFMNKPEGKDSASESGSAKHDNQSDNSPNKIENSKNMDNIKNMFINQDPTKNFIGTFNSKKTDENTSKPNSLFGQNIPSDAVSNGKVDENKDSLIRSETNTKDIGKEADANPDTATENNNEQERNAKNLFNSPLKPVKSMFGEQSTNANPFSLFGPAKDTDSKPNPFSTKNPFQTNQANNPFTNTNNSGLFTKTPNTTTDNKSFGDFFKNDKEDEVNSDYDPEAENNDQFNTANPDLS
mmetsp:Transcript_99786/g.215275  ORF Transcript_99786/g.215275 Transcript_99786/m.215275 type:complete len:250 (-) Transcript_99786:484-1233(-)